MMGERRHMKKAVRENQQKIFRHVIMRKGIDNIIGTGMAEGSKLRDRMVKLV